jgi:hypothetical protein
MHPYISEMLGRAHREELLRQAAKARGRSSNRDHRAGFRLTAVIQARWEQARGGFRRSAGVGDQTTTRAAPPVWGPTEPVQNCEEWGSPALQCEGKPAPPDLLLSDVEIRTYVP